MALYRYSRVGRLGARPSTETSSASTTRSAMMALTQNRDVLNTAFSITATDALRDEIPDEASGTTVSMPTDPSPQIPTWALVGGAVLVGLFAWKVLR